MATMLREPGPNRLREVRRKRGVSVYVLAAETGMDPNTIYRIERGKLPVRRPYRYLLALALRCAVEDLFPDETS